MTYFPPQQPVTVRMVTVSKRPVWGVISIILAVVVLLLSVAEFFVLRAASFANLAGFFSVESIVNQTWGEVDDSMGAAFSQMLNMVLLFLGLLATQLLLGLIGLVTSIAGIAANSGRVMSVISIIIGSVGGIAGFILAGSFGLW